MFSWWVLGDTKQFYNHRPYELGAFIFFNWPLVLPVYLITARGMLGILIFLFLFLYYISWQFDWGVYNLNSSNL